MLPDRVSNPGPLIFLRKERTNQKEKKQKKLENVFVKHYATNHMPHPKGDWSLKENNSELLYGICSKVKQFIYTLVCNYSMTRNY